MMQHHRNKSLVTQDRGLEVIGSTFLDVRATPDDFVCNNWKQKYVKNKMAPTGSGMKRTCMAHTWNLTRSQLLYVLQERNLLWSLGPLVPAQSPAFNCGGLWDVLRCRHPFNGQKITQPLLVSISPVNDVLRKTNPHTIWACWHRLMIYFWE